MLFLNKEWGLSSLYKCKNLFYYSGFVVFFLGGGGEGFCSLYILSVLLFLIGKCNSSQTGWWIRVKEQIVVFVRTRYAIRVMRRKIMEFRCSKRQAVNSSEKCMEVVAVTVDKVGLVGGSMFPGEGLVRMGQ